MTRVHICSIPVILTVSEQFKKFFFSSWLLSVDDIQILCLAWDCGFRIISRLRLSFDCAKISDKSLWEFSSDKWEVGELSCSPEIAAVLVMPNPVQEGRTTPSSTQHSTGEEGHGCSQVPKQGWGIDRGCCFRPLYNLNSPWLHWPNNCCTGFLAYCWMSILIFWHL